MYALRLISFTLAVLAACYVALSPLVAMPLYNTVLFHPYKYPSGAYDIDAIGPVKRQDVFFPSVNGAKLHGWIFRHPQSRKTVLVSHGNGGNISHRLTLAATLLHAGASVFVYDYQGYGRSEGEPSIAGICDDGRAAYAYLTEVEKVAPETVVLYGESLGNAVTCKLMSEKPCAGVILQSPFSSLVTIGQEKLHLLRLYPSWLFPKPDLDNVLAVHRPHPPLLIMHGKQDGLLPVGQSEILFREALEPKRLIVLPGAEHNNVPDQPEFIPAVNSYLSSLP